MRFLSTLSRKPTTTGRGAEIDTSMPKASVAVLMLLIANVHSQRSIYASLIQLEKVHQLESKFLFDMQSLTEQIQENLGKIKSIIEEVKVTRSEITEVSQHLQNPLNAFVFLHSIITYSTELLKSLGPMNSMQSLLKETIHSENWPTLLDAKGAASSILMLRSTYNLEVDSLVQGKLSNHSSSPLSVIHCLFIAKTASKKGQTGEANRWTEIAFEMCHNPDKNNICDTELKILTAEHFAYTNFMSGDLIGALKITDLLLHLAPDNKRAKINRRYLISEINNVSVHQRNGEFMVDPNGNVNKDQYHYFCCRGLARPYKINISSLTCQYVHYNNPYLLIGPIKEEVVHLEPRIVLLKEVISDSEIEEIKNITTPILERSKRADGVITDTIVSKVARLKKEDGSLPLKLLIRFSSYADLPVLRTDVMNVVNYGLGGYNLPHFDAIDAKFLKKSRMSNRIATFLVYLSNVEKGGATVFTRLGLSVKPEKGSAVLWYNVLNSGATDTETEHAACPVLQGNKWVISLWFKETWNELTKP